MSTAQKSARKVRTVKNQNVAVTVRDTMVALIEARKSALADNGRTVAVEWASILKTISGENGQGFVNAVAALHGLIDLQPLCDILPNWDDKQTPAARYVQAKTVQKVVNLMHALAGGTTDKMSSYTLQVLRAALDNGGNLSLTGAQASLSRRVARPDAEVLTSRANYSVGTASAQSSQVRDVLRVLGLAEVNKGKRNDTFKLNEGALSKLREVFAMNDNATEAGEPVEA